MALLRSLTTGRRNRAPGCPTARALSEMPARGSSFVVGFSEDVPADLRARLRHLGFHPGAPVEVLRHAPLGGPVICRVADYEICLRREQARLILLSEAA